MESCWSATFQGAGREQGARPLPLVLILAVSVRGWRAPRFHVKRQDDDLKDLPAPLHVMN
jgi:hypothetical protein